MHCVVCFAIRLVQKHCWWFTRFEATSASFTMHKTASNQEFRTRSGSI